MEMSDPELYNLAMTAKQSQLMSRYCKTNNKNNDNNNKYNMSDCGRSSLDCVTKKPGQWIETNWEQTSLVMLNCARAENESIPSGSITWSVLHGKRNVQSKEVNFEWKWWRQCRQPPCACVSYLPYLHVCLHCQMSTNVRDWGNLGVDLKQI